MTSNLTWNVPPRAQSAGPALDWPPSVSTSTSSAGNVTPGASPALPSHSFTRFHTPQAYGLNRSSLGSAPPTRKPPGSALPSPSAGVAGGRNHLSSRYWELGGLGPAHVSTPEWQVRKEKWLRQKSFGKTANAANMQHPTCNRRAQQPIEDKSRKPSISTSPLPSQARPETPLGAAELASRAERKDIAAAMALWS